MASPRSWLDERLPVSGEDLREPLHELRGLHVVAGGLPPHVDAGRVELADETRRVGLHHAELRTRLKDAGFDDDLVKRVINELEGADFARFAASGVNREEMERCLKRTTTIVERVERARGGGR